MDSKLGIKGSIDETATVTFPVSAFPTIFISITQGKLSHYIYFLTIFITQTPCCVVIAMIPLIWSLSVAPECMLISAS